MKLKGKASREVISLFYCTRVQLDKVWLLLSPVVNGPHTHTGHWTGALNHSKGNIGKTVKSSSACHFLFVWQLLESLSLKKIRLPPFFTEPQIYFVQLFNFYLLPHFFPNLSLFFHCTSSQLCKKSIWPVYNQLSA